MEDNTEVVVPVRKRWICIEMHDNGSRTDGFFVNDIMVGKFFDLDKVYIVDILAPKSAAVEYSLVTASISAAKRYIEENYHQF